MELIFEINPFFTSIYLST